MFLGPQVEQDAIPHNCMRCAVNIQNREAAWKFPLTCLSLNTLTLKLHQGAGL